MGCGEGCARFILVVFNTVFVLSGLGLLVVGIIIKADKDIVNLQKLVEFDSNGSFLSTAAYILIGFGIFVLVIGALGCFGAIKQNKVLLALYIGFLAIIFLGEFTGGILAAVFKGKLEDTLDDTLKKSLVNYNPNSTNTVMDRAWDGVQGWLQCCGVDAYYDYYNVTFFRTKPVKQYVPDSCCISNVTACQLEAAPTNKKATNFHFIHHQGCLNELNDQLKSHMTILIGVGVGIAMIQLFGIFLACCAWKRGESVDQNSPY